MMKIIQVRQNGLMTIPIELRRRYQLNEGDSLTIIDLGEGLFLTRKRSVLPELVTKIEEVRKKYNVSVEELIDGVAEERNKKEYSKVADR